MTTDNSDSKDEISAIGEKLDGLAKVLKLYPYDKHGQFQDKLKPVSYASIQAAQVVQMQLYVKLLPVTHAHCFK